MHYTTDPPSRPGVVSISAWPEIGDGIGVVPGGPIRTITDVPCTITLAVPDHCFQAESDLAQVQWAIFDPAGQQLWSSVPLHVFRGDVIDLQVSAASGVSVPTR